MGSLNEVKSADHLGAAKAELSDISRFAEVEQGLVFLGMVGIKDPARPEESQPLIHHPRDCQIFASVLYSPLCIPC